MSHHVYITCVFFSRSPALQHIIECFYSFVISLVTYVVGGMWAHSSCFVRHFLGLLMLFQARMVKLQK